MRQLNNPALFREHVCYINGVWQAAEGGLSLAVTNPANGLVLGSVPYCGLTEAHLAIQAADAAGHVWRALTAKSRADVLHRWAHLIETHKEDLATLLTLEQGKPFAEAIAEIEYGNAFITWFAEEGRRVYGDVIPSNKPKQHLLVLKQALGVVAAITPWNFPIAMITRKCAPALAAGCTVVLKPTSKTPFCAYALAVLAEEAGMPAGVFNVITGDANILGAELSTNPIVKKLSFTGSTAVGKLLMHQCASTVKKVSLELGGNAPFIVFDDANIDAAIRGLMIAKFRNSGQTCVCANRIYVHDTIYNLFAQKLMVAVSQLTVGDGFDANTLQGPLINQGAFDKVKAHIADASEKGAEVLCGGKAHALGGLFFEPTVLANVDASMLIAQEETFGPVAPLFRFETEEEVIALANATPFGLAAYFYSQDIDRVWRVTEALEYGMVGVNEGLISTEVAPFGGIKESGIGREGSKYGIEEYLELKYVCMKSS